MSRLTEARYIAAKATELTYYATVGSKKTMYYWDTKNYVWIKEGDLLLLKWVKEEYPEVTSSIFREVEFEVQSLTLMREREFKANENYLQFREKVLDLRTLEIEPTTPEYYITTKLDTRLDSRAPPPKQFIKALKKCFSDPEDLFHCLQAFASLLLIRTERIEKIFFMTGSGENGKSTLLKALDNVFEDYIDHIAPKELIDETFASSNLVGKIANFDPDISESELKDLSKLKKAATGDRVSVQRKYQDRENANVKIIQIYGANKMPEITEKSRGIFRRLSIINMPEVIKKVDPHIDEKLGTEEERAGILNMLIRVARFTRKKGFIYEKSITEIQDIVEQKASPVKQLLDNEKIIKQNEKSRISKNRFYSLYVKFCKENSYYPLSDRKFNAIIKKEGYESLKSNSEVFWIGLEDVNKPEEAQLKL